MKKIQYIAPAIKVVEMDLADGILNSLSGGSTLGNGGTTSENSVTTSDTKAERSDYNVWNDDWSK